MSTLTSDSVRAMAEAAAIRIDDDAAARVVRAMAPALDAFSAAANALELECEPATYLLTQRRAAENP